MEAVEALAMASDNPHFPARLRTARKEGAGEIDRRLGIGGEPLIVRRERDEPRKDLETSRERITILNLALMAAEAALSDIGDADREPGDDVAWLEERAAKALPAVRSALLAVTPNARGKA